MAGATSEERVEVTTRSSSKIMLKRSCLPDDPACARALGPLAYSVTLVEKTLSQPGSAQRYTYFDRAAVTRHRDLPAVRKAHAFVSKP